MKARAPRSGTSLPTFQKALFGVFFFFFRLLSNLSNTARRRAYRRAFAGNARYYRNNLGLDFCHFYHLAHKQAAAAAWPSSNRCVCLTRIRCFGLDTPSLIYDNAAQEIRYLGFFFSPAATTRCGGPWRSLTSPTPTSSRTSSPKPRCSPRRSLWRTPTKRRPKRRR